MEHTLYRTPVNHKTHTHIRVRPNVLGFISAFYYLVFIKLIIWYIIQLDVSISYLESHIIELMVGWVKWNVWGTYFRDGLQHTEVDTNEPIEVFVSKAKALHIKVSLSLTAQVRNLLGQNFSAQHQWIVIQKGRKGVRSDCRRDRCIVKLSGSWLATEKIPTK